jgi:NitT/TauT family transport system substrate-binding protein
MASRLSRRQLCAGLIAASAFAFTPRVGLTMPRLRAATLKFGTVNWLLNVITHHKLDEAEGFKLDIIELASTNATQVALLANEVELIVADWFWVMRQRALGGDLKYMPYSASLGSVLVPPGSASKSVSDLKGVRIGVAGGPLDKSWLLLRAYGKTQGSGDIAAIATPVFGAPPLLNEQIKAGRVDALLNYWHFAARLEAEGYRRIITVADMMQAVGIQTVLPLVGFVFPARLSEGNGKVARGLANAMQNAQKLLLTSDEEWRRIRPLMNAASDAEFNILRERFREGLLHTWGPRDREAAARLFEILAEVGGDELTGAGVNFDPKAFWDGLIF